MGKGKTKSASTAFVRTAPLRSALPTPSPPSMQIEQPEGTCGFYPAGVAAVSPLSAAVASDILPAGAAAGSGERRGKEMGEQSWLGSSGVAG